MFLTACEPATKLERVKTQVVLPPEITCQSRPAVPSIDALARPDGDKVLGIYIARLEDWGADCEDGVKAFNDWRKQHLEQ